MFKAGQMVYNKTNDAKLYKVLAHSAHRSYDNGIIKIAYASSPQIAIGWDVADHYILYNSKREIKTEVDWLDQVKDNFKDGV